MKLLLKHVTVVDPGGPLDTQQLDILLVDGMIVRTGAALDADAHTETWEMDDLHVSPGWMDIGARTMDPGFEHREDIHSLCRAAAAGGYTALVVFPNTDPVVHSKAEVQYQQSLNERQPVQLLPIGAISRQAAGEEIAEMYDMAQAGAIAFSDGIHPVERAGLLLRALLYVRPLDGLVIDRPMDLSLAAGGQVHEGEVSIRMGVRGIPTLAESTRVHRNIELLRYAESRLMLHGVSAADSLSMIQSAREEGLDLTTATPVWNLIFTDEQVATYDAGYKLMPPLRTAQDRDRLRQALREGILDLICSDHTPLEDDCKEVEFPYAAFGAGSLETVFALCRTHLVPEVLSLPELIRRLAVRPREILRIAVPHIEEGQPAELTLFRPNSSWVFDKGQQQSRGPNNPMHGQTLKGVPEGVIRGMHVWRRS
jgi:dihydroorotase